MPDINNMFSVSEFGSDNRLEVRIFDYTDRLNIQEVITLRKWLTKEINRVQQPVADRLHGKPSPQVATKP